MKGTNLPIFSIPPEHQFVLRLADIVAILILDFLDILLRLDALVFGESPLMSFLDIPISSVAISTLILMDTGLVCWFRTCCLPFAHEQENVVQRVQGSADSALRGCRWP